jgi:hypothetical protein
MNMRTISGRCSASQTEWRLASYSIEASKHHFKERGIARGVDNDIYALGCPYSIVDPLKIEGYTAASQTPEKVRRGGNGSGHGSGQALDGDPATSNLMGTKIQYHNLDVLSIGKGFK